MARKHRPTFPEDPFQGPSYHVVRDDRNNTENNMAGDLEDIDSDKMDIQLARETTNGREAKNEPEVVVMFGAKRL